ncbi:hypothetical protein CLOACE_02950 [Clostridium acetireducens DSM 10703]|uniref:Uncharacterized protein n=1 Tax=Clostridium acetireducens DSM 10703 TaxID=1121290 RepID=A0A1E8F279_9CLOT|nr:hypothetical protein [Clostridium acetireducens]OFI07466.1 hypothetical protein CLOACE_02950 [Clostridium acetireducens DSM 10703]
MGEKEQILNATIKGLSNTAIVMIKESGLDAVKEEVIAINTMCSQIINRWNLDKELYFKHIEAINNQVLLDEKFVIGWEL